MRLLDVSQRLRRGASAVLEHCRAAPARLYRFDIPRNLYNEWLGSGEAVEGIDSYGGITRPVVRIDPPVSGRLNGFMVPP
jgi:hypothetical protein